MLTVEQCLTQNILIWQPLAPDAQEADIIDTVERQRVQK